MWELLQPQVYGSLPYKGLVPAVLAGLLVGAGTKVSHEGATSSFLQAREDQRDFRETCPELLTQLMHVCQVDLLEL